MGDDLICPKCGREAIREKRVENRGPDNTSGSDYIHEESQTVLGGILPANLIEDACWVPDDE